MEKSLIKPFIAKRVAQEFTDGMVVNLGIGLPVLCTSFLPEGIHVTVHSELGIVGQGPAPDEAHADPMHIVDAGGSASSIVLGGIAGMALAYPLYRRITEKNRKKIAPQILRLSEELINGGK